MTLIFPDESFSPARHGVVLMGVGDMGYQTPVAILAREKFTIIWPCYFFCQQQIS